MGKTPFPLFLLTFPILLQSVKALEKMHYLFQDGRLGRFSTVFFLDLAAMFSFKLKSLR